MCFYISEEFSEEKVRIAEQDIIVWKMLDENKVSPYYEYKYEVGILQPKVELIIDECNSIEEGYHFYIHPMLGFMNYKFIIPKGTKYFINDFEGEIVSETCMMVKGNYLTNEEIIETIKPLISDKLQKKFNKYFIDSLEDVFSGKLPTKEELEKDVWCSAFGIFKSKEKKVFWYSWGIFYSKFYDKFGYNFLILNVLMLNVLHSTLKLRDITPNWANAFPSAYCIIH